MTSVCTEINCLNTTKISVTQQNVVDIFKSNNSRLNFTTNRQSVTVNAKLGNNKIKTAPKIFVFLSGLQLHQSPCTVPTHGPHVIHVCLLQILSVLLSINYWVVICRGDEVFKFPSVWKSLWKMFLNFNFYTFIFIAGNLISVNWIIKISWYPNQLKIMQLQYVFCYCNSLDSLPLSKLRKMQNQ